MADATHISQPDEGVVKQIIDVSVKGYDELMALAKLMNTIAKGHDVEKYWVKQEDLINGVTTSLKQYKEEASSINAENLVKFANALQAVDPSGLDKLLVKYEDLNGVLENARKEAALVNEVFDPVSLKGYFTSLEMIKEKGIDLSGALDRLFRSDNVQSYVDRINQLNEQMSSLKTSFDEIKEKNDKYTSGDYVSGLIAEVDQLKESLSETESKLEEFKKKALSAFNSFLSANNLDDAEWGSELYNSILYLKEEIKQGETDANEAISSIKGAFYNLFGEESGGGRDIQMIVEMRQKLDALTESINEYSAAQREAPNSPIREDGAQPAIKMLEGLVSASDDTIEKVSRINEVLSETVSAIKELGDVPTNKVEALGRLFSSLNKMNDLKLPKTSFENLTKFLQTIDNIKDLNKVNELSLIDFSKWKEFSVSAKEITAFGESLKMMGHVDAEKVKAIASVNMAKYWNLLSPKKGAAESLAEGLKLFNKVNADKLKEIASVNMAKNWNQIKIDPKAAQQIVDLADAFRMLQKYKNSTETTKSDKTGQDDTGSEEGTRRWVENLRKVEDSYARIINATKTFRNLSKTREKSDTGTSVYEETTRQMQAQQEIIDRELAGLKEINAQYPEIVDKSKKRVEYEQLTAKYQDEQRIAQAAAIDAANTEAEKERRIAEAAKDAAEESSNLQQWNENLKKVEEGYSRIIEAMKTFRTLSKSKNKTDDGTAVYEETTRQMEAQQKIIDKELVGIKDIGAQYPDIIEQSKRRVEYEQLILKYQEEQKLAQAVSADAADKEAEREERIATAAKDTAEAFKIRKMYSLEEMYKKNSKIIDDNDDLADAYAGIQASIQSIGEQSGKLSATQKAELETRIKGLNAEFRELEQIEKEQAKIEKDAKKIAPLMAQFNQYLKSVNPKGLEESAVTLAKIKDYADEGNFEELRTTINNLKAHFKELGYEGGNAFTFLYQKMRTFIVYLASSRLTMLFSSAFRNAITDVNELNKALTDLRIITGYNIDQAEDMMKTYNALAKEIGSTTAAVAESAQGWLRQGYSIQESNELVRQSMALSVMGEMEAAQSTEAITAALKGYRLEASAASSVVDKFFAVDMRAATSSGKLAEALAKVAANAKLSGLSMDMVIGQLAVVNESMQEAGEETGKMCA